MRLWYNDGILGLTMPEGPAGEKMMKKLFLILGILAFCCLPAGAQDFHFDVLSDSHLMQGKDGIYRSYPATAETVGALIADRPDFVIHCGDMISINSRNGHRDVVEGMWRRFDESVKTPLLKAGLPLLITRGNHDVYGELGKELYEHFWKDYSPAGIALDSGRIERYYSFMHKGCQFIVLDGSGISISKEQAAWLRGELKRRPGRKALFVISHVGLKGQPRHKEDYMRGELPEIMKGCGPVWFISGHHHLYEAQRMGNIVHIVSGSAGETPPAMFVRFRVSEGRVTAEPVKV